MGTGTGDGRGKRKKEGGEGVSPGIRVLWCVRYDVCVCV